MKRYLAVFLVLLMTACASSRGFDRGALRALTMDQKVVTEEDIGKALELKPQLPAPFKLAVYFARPKTDLPFGVQWNWTGEDKDSIMQMKPELIKRGLISDMFVLPESILESSGIRAVRLAAARAGADAVLVINGVSSVDRYNNALGRSYMLIVTPFFISGTVLDGLVMANAVMWDVRNQYLYLAVEAEASSQQTFPAVFTDEKRVINEARTGAVAGLKKELATRFETVSLKQQ